MKSLSIHDLKVGEVYNLYNNELDKVYFNVLFTDTRLPTPSVINVVLYIFVYPEQYFYGVPGPGGVSPHLTVLPSVYSKKELIVQDVDVLFNKWTIRYELR